MWVLPVFPFMVCEVLHIRLRKFLILCGFRSISRQMTVVPPKRISCISSQSPKPFLMLVSIQLPLICKSFIGLASTVENVLYVQTGKRDWIALPTTRCLDSRESLVNFVAHANEIGGKEYFFLVLSK